MRLIRLCNFIMQLPETFDAAFRKIARINCRRDAMLTCNDGPWASEGSRKSLACKVILPTGFVRFSENA